MPVYNLETMDEHVRAAYLLPRVAAMLFGVFGAIGLVLATVGLYGVMSFAVTRRTREIGIRMAMGASSGTVVGMVLRRTLLLAGAGVVLGTAGALAITRVLRTFLFEVRPTDPATFTAVALFLISVALVAALLPARRAYAVDPLVALRYE